MTPTTSTSIADELLTVSQLRVRLHCRQSEVRPWLEAHHVPARKGPGRALDCQGIAKPGDKKSGGGWLGNHRGILGSWPGWDRCDLFQE